MVGLEEGIVLDAPATTYIAPLKIDLGQQRAPKRSATHDLQAVSPYTMLPTEEQRRGRIHHRFGTEPRLSPGHNNQTQMRGGMPTHLDDASKEGNDIHGCRRCRHRLKTGKTFICNIAHMHPRPPVGATPSKLDHFAAAATPRHRSRNDAVHQLPTRTRARNPSSTSHAAENP